MRDEAYEINQSVLRDGMGRADRDFARSRANWFSDSADLIEDSLKSGVFEAKGS
ncbi:hypothetical protein [Hyphomicrobium sp. ghe19]|uniref:hypothetical protein n=1 Tax=Hyphomicrobium sp. ghe19 TaxID=2682968 RepID=UPI0013679962|nr:hypothetical protein HYPP_02406 [Hyphomicrobium sp. ghe19]